MKKWNHSRNTNVFCPLQLDGVRAQIYDSFILLWDASGFPPADCTGDSHQPQWEWVAKAPHFDLCRGSVHPWRLLSQERVFQRAKIRCWFAFSTAALEMEEIEQLSALPSLLEVSSVVGLLRVEQKVSISPTRSTIWHSLVPSRHSFGD